MHKKTGNGVVVECIATDPRRPTELMVVYHDLSDFDWKIIPWENALASFSNLYRRAPTSAYGVGSQWFEDNADPNT